MRCSVCNKPRAWDHRDTEFPLLPIALGIFLLFPSYFTGDVTISIVGIVFIMLGVWLIHHMRTTDYCKARPEWGEICEKAYTLSGKERENYFNHIEQARGQARHNQHEAWGRRGEDPKWDSFAKEYPNFKRRGD